MIIEWIRPLLGESEETIEIRRLESVLEELKELIAKKRDVFFKSMDNQDFDNWQKLEQHHGKIDESICELEDLKRIKDARREGNLRDMLLIVIAAVVMIVVVLK